MTNPLELSHLLLASAASLSVALVAGGLGAAVAVFFLLVLKPRIPQRGWRYLLWFFPYARVLSLALMTALFWLAGSSSASITVAIFACCAGIWVWEPLERAQLQNISINGWIWLRHSLFLAQVAYLLEIVLSFIYQSSLLRSTDTLGYLMVAQGCNPSPAHLWPAFFYAVGALLLQFAMILLPEPGVAHE